VVVPVPDWALATEARPLARAKKAMDLVEDILMDMYSFGLVRLDRSMMAQVADREDQQ